MPGFFISYRRSDNPDAVGRIYDRLVAEFGKARVFKDVDSIPLGQDFRAHLNGVVADCAAVLAIIGPRWTDVRNESGQKRLEDPDDFVRIELEAALARHVPVVPVLVGHAQIPVATQLPASLVSLAYRQSIEVRPDPDFHHDATRLVQALRVIIDPNAAQELPVGTLLPGGPVSAGAATSKRPLLPWLVAAIATVAAGVLAMPALKRLREAPPSEMFLDVDTGPSDNARSFALSPDGTMIVYPARSNGLLQLWLRTFSNQKAIALPGTENANFAFWSPDSRSIKFFSPGRLSRLDLASGQVTKETDFDHRRAFGSWSKKGDVLLTAFGEHEFLHVAADHTQTSLAPLGNDCDYSLVKFLPDGLHYLVNAHCASGGLYMASLDGEHPVRLAEAPQAFDYLPSGWLLQVLFSGRLVAQRLDLHEKKLVGVPLPMAEQVSAVSASATGVIAFRGGGNERQLVHVDHKGNPLGAIDVPDFSLNNPRFSQNGKWVAYARQAPNRSSIFVQGVDQNRTPGPQTNEPVYDYPMFWPDSSQLVFHSTRQDGLYTKKLNGADQPQKLKAAGDADAFPTGTLQNDLLYFASGTDGSMTTYVLHEDRRRELVRKAGRGHWAQGSPDGKWIVYQATVNEREEIFLKPVAGQHGEDGRQVTTDGGNFPTWCWNPDTKRLEICYLGRNGYLMTLYVDLQESTTAPEPPVRLFPAEIIGGTAANKQGRQYDASAADGSFVINRSMDAGPITVLLDWNPAAHKPLASSP